FLFKPNHITLLNIAADDSDIAPEFIQTELKATALAHEAQSMLADEALRQAQIDAQNKALSRMGERDEAAAEIAAKAILEVISAR
ncbi:MAG: lipid-A-disaccharide synthase, partial [Pseudomonadota bacterium]